MATLLGDVCPYPGHSVKDVVAKYSEVITDAKGKGQDHLVQLPCDPESLSPQHGISRFGHIKGGRVSPGTAELTCIRGVCHLDEK